MDAGDLAPLGYAAIAAAFGYLATLVIRRYEVVRSMAVEIDDELRGAFNEALRDDLEPIDQLNVVNERLMRAELRTGGLPRAVEPEWTANCVSRSRFYSTCSR